MRTEHRITDGLTVPYKDDLIIFEIEHINETDTDENGTTVNGFHFNIAPYGLIKNTITVVMSKEHLQQLATAIINVIVAANDGK